jgi:putative endonuclease
VTEIQNRSDPDADSQPWYVYMVRCADRSLYTGISTDPERRLHEHNHDNKRAAAYTRSRRPVVLVYCETHTSRSLASRREYEIKQLTTVAKQLLIRDK